MSMLELAGVDLHGVVMSVTEDDDGIMVRLTGSADSRMREQIQSCLLETHHAAQRKHALRVLIDLRQLEFMNSACLKAFVSWLADVRSLDQAKQYRIYFLSNPNIHWQRRSLYALSCFAAELVSITH